MTTILIIINFIFSLNFRTFLGERTKLCTLPVNSGLVFQGLTWNKDNDTYVTVGYRKNKPSQICTLKFDERKKLVTKFYNLKSQGKDFFGHSGGIEYLDGMLYLANESTGIFAFSADFAPNSSEIEIGTPLKCNSDIKTKSSFIYGKKDNDGRKVLYAGEFSNSHYKTSNFFDWKGKSHKAALVKYVLQEESKELFAEEVYSIPDQIQGCAFLDDGTIVLSESWSLSPSKFHIYRNEKIELTDMTTKDGCKIYFLDEESEIKSAPPMSEDLDVKNGKIIYLSELATNKYILGKFVGENGVYSFSAGESF